MRLVVLPLTLPGLVAVGIYLFISSWNEYLFALMLAGRRVRTVTVALQSFIGENQVQWGLLMAGGTLVGAAGDPPVPAGPAPPRRRLDRRSREGMSAAWPPAIGVISMTYARPITAEHLQLFARMRAAGMDFCELLVPEPDEIDPAVVGEAARAAGLSLVLAARVDVHRDLASDDNGARQGGLAYLRRCVDIAVACGADLIGGPLYGTPLVFAGRAPRPFDAAQRSERVARVVEGLQAGGRVCRGRGVRLAIEPLNRFETDFCNTARQACELACLVGSPAVGVMLDTFHMNMEENDLPEAIRRAAPHLLHFQANENHRGYLGTGHIEWPPICRALFEIGYAGRVTLEPFRRTDHGLSVPLAQWKPPAYDEDEDLRSSGALLRAALHAAARS